MEESKLSVNRYVCFKSLNFRTENQILEESKLSVTDVFVFVSKV